ncbi:hypothetical protein GWI33_014517 [Rhynchophorus ferrugineus]|uniref:Uncharacterized protein n=1 Tax=Rhynchophorus ferrugineus TaxID=354439 RepID=A0A834MCA1_RHYFE|nr:hypothetical protein GWI33_014517 [Rhynchophorus ferrugineus]
MAGVFQNYPDSAVRRSITSTPTTATPRFVIGPWGAARAFTGLPGDRGSVSDLHADVGLFAGQIGFRSNLAVMNGRSPVLIGRASVGDASEAISRAQLLNF